VVGGIAEAKEKASGRRISLLFSLLAGNLARHPWISAAQWQLQPPRLRQHSRRAADPSTCGTVKSRISCWRDAAPSRGEAYGRACESGLPCDKKGGNSKTNPISFKSGNDQLIDKLFLRP
jgi:hypothetical protein